MVMVGSLAGLELPPIRKETFQKAVAECVPTETEEMNIRAFELGYEEIKRAMR